jgi:ribosomal protein S18 acetylase RimI-like enzyme
MTVEIVPFAAEHLDGVLALCRAEGWPSFPADPARALRSLTAPGVVALVAVDGTRVVGFAQALTDGALQAYLAQLATAADRRGEGIGRALVAEVLRRDGAIRLDLVTDSAGEFYESLPHRKFTGYRLYPAAPDGAGGPYQGPPYP